MLDKMLTLNTAKSNLTLPLLLHEASLSNTHIVCIQEPCKYFINYKNPKKYLPNPEWDFFYENPENEEFPSTRSAIAVSQKIPSKHVVHIPVHFKDVTIIKYNKIIICNVYQVPNSTNVISALPILLSPFLSSHAVIIVGDFNARNLLWDVKENKAGKAVQNFLNKLNLTLLTECKENENKDINRTLMKIF